MIKRISILIRRPQDDREAFSEHWNGMHGALVAKLPAIGRYVQNHVLDEFSVVASELGGYDIDGFVELYFEDDRAMRNAFSGPEAQPIWADEPNFLGHSTAYAITGDRYPNPSVTDAKLVVVASGSRAGIDWLGDKLRMLENTEAIERNDVAEVIPRTTMARGPQPADVFFHCRFTSVDAAREGGGRMAAFDLARSESYGIERLAITRVIEKRIV